MSDPTRPSGRAPDALRTLSFTRKFTKHAEGSVLVAMGDTQRALHRQRASTRSRRTRRAAAKAGSPPNTACCRAPPTPACDREAARGKQSGRTQEIQRLIGRSLRAVVDLKKLGERTMHIDCDVHPGRRRHPHRQHLPAPLSRWTTRSAGLLADGKLAETPLKRQHRRHLGRRLPGPAGARPRLPRRLRLRHRHERGDDGQRRHRRSAGHGRRRAVFPRRPSKPCSTWPPPASGRSPRRNSKRAANHEQTRHRLRQRRQAT